MYTPDRFVSEWKRLHHPAVRVGSDAAFYDDVYVRLHRLAERHARGFDEAGLLSLLLYTENLIAVGLDGVYEYRYRSVGNVVFRWCDGLGMSAAAISEVDRLVSEAVAEAPRSSLRRWMSESVLSGDFRRLSEMLAYFPREDRVLRRIFPDLRYREAMFLRLTGDRQTARRMLVSDLAFNWRDKRGGSLAETLAVRFRLQPCPGDEEERESSEETAGLLETVRSERLDFYTAVGRAGRRTLTLRHRDGRVFRDVMFPSPLPENVLHSSLAAQLVTWRDKTCVSGPAVWLHKEALPAWNGEDLWKGILRKEQDAARSVSFTTVSGKRLSLYEDLYTVPEDPEEARDADWGIYWDEPDIFDFMERLKPSGPSGRVMR